MNEIVEIVEVGPRDGMQNEPDTLSVAQKIALIDSLSQVGFRRIEAGAFVLPKAIPQMAQTDQVFAGLSRAAGVSYGALAPNMKGYDAARSAGVDEISVFVSASEGFSKANLNASIADSLDRYRPVLQAARHVDLPVRGYVSCVTDCPYDGPVSPDAVVRVAADLFAMGCYEISLGDTIGKGTADSVAKMILKVRDTIPVHRLAGHFHDTDGHAIGNVDTALSLGVRVFDASVNGLGGCPFAPGASGNVATETLDKHLKALGYRTGLNDDALSSAVAIAKDLTGMAHV